MEAGALGGGWGAGPGFAGRKGAIFTTSFQAGRPPYRTLGSGLSVRVLRATAISPRPRIPSAALVAVVAAGRSALAVGSPWL